MSIKGVPVGLIPTPFDARIRALNTAQAWHWWAGYAAATTLGNLEMEYGAIRNQATLFDISPMHKYRITGPDAEAVLNRLVTRDIRKIAPGRVGYALWCDEDGEVIDDGTVFRFARDDFRLCCQEPQLGWLSDVAEGFDVTLSDESTGICGLALQGPSSFALLEAAGLGKAAALKPFDFASYEKAALMISRTGFTGDLGYELWTTPDRALELWDRLWQAGENFAIRAIGLEALNMARIEAGFVMTGTEFASTHTTIRRHRGRTPFELGMGHMVHFDKPHFNGRRALLQHRENGPRYMLVGLDIEGDKPAADAYVYHKRKNVAGQVNAAIWSPLGKSNLALAMLKAPFGIDVTDNLWVEIYTLQELKWERLMMRARIVPRPFLRLPRHGVNPPEYF